MKLEGYEYVQANRHSSRRGHEPEVVVIHYTASRGDVHDLARYFARARNASAHFGVDRSGEVVQMVDTDRNAWHAGRSSFRGRSPVGRISIGIELCNAGYGRFDRSAGVFRGRHRNPACRATEWEPYRDEQLRALEGLLRDLVRTHPSLKYVTGHEDIRNTHVVDGIRGSKVDPGPAFPWGDVCLAGLEQWHWSFRDREWYSCGPAEAPTH